MATVFAWRKIVSHLHPKASLRIYFNKYHQCYVALLQFNVYILHLCMAASKRVKVDVVALDKQFVCCIKGTLDTLVLETQYGSTLLLIEQLSDLLSCQIVRLSKG